MRIGMTIGTFAKGDSRVAGFVIWSRRMTFLAGDLSVQSSQGIARLRMVELPHAYGFPIVVGMTQKAVLPQPSFVLILMAGDAVSGNAQKCLIQIFDFDDSALGLRHVLSRVTTIAGQPRVFALERVSRLLMIEGPYIPLD
jgi:hypothetical protein